MLFKSVVRARYLKTFNRLCHRCQLIAEPRSLQFSRSAKVIRPNHPSLCILNELAYCDKLWFERSDYAWQWELTIAILSLLQFNLHSGKGTRNPDDTVLPFILFYPVSASSFERSRTETRLGPSVFALRSSSELPQQPFSDLFFVRLCG